jgi:molybdopterin molybdotransferase
MITFDEARVQILAGVTRLGRERVPLGEAAGRVLAESVTATRPFPPVDLSAMDGYAVRTDDFSGAAPFRFPVAPAESRAGQPAPGLPAGAVGRIFTGAGLPGGADAVVMQEEVTRDGDWASFAARPRPGQHVRVAGEDLRTGALAMDAGTRLHAGHLALAASLDRAELVVGRTPSVAILCTGDELHAPGTAYAAGAAAIAESNGVALAALVRQVGGRPRLLPSVGDTLDATVAALGEALIGADLVLTVGGVSVGDHDLVRPALERLGVTIELYKVAIKPGKPLVFGTRPGPAGTTRVLGLPGNPASALTTFALFGAPLVRAMQGDAVPLPLFLPARLAAPVRHKPGRLEFARVTLDRRGSELSALPLTNQASGATTSMGWATAFALVPLEAGDLAEGTPVEVLRLGDV